eukprot:3731507-Rhodomonas_salina.4
MGSEVAGNHWVLGIEEVANARGSAHCPRHAVCYALSAMLPITLYLLCYLLRSICYATCYALSAMLPATFYLLCYLLYPLRALYQLLRYLPTHSLCDVRGASWAGLARAGVGAGATPLSAYELRYWPANSATGLRARYGQFDQIQSEFCIWLSAMRCAVLSWHMLATRGRGEGGCCRRASMDRRDA